MRDGIDTRFVALLQQASEIDWVTVRSCFLYRAAADNSFSGFRRLQFHAAEQSGGPKFLPSTFGRLVGGLLFRGTGSARARRKNISRTVRAAGPTRSTRLFRED